MPPKSTTQNKPPQISALDAITPVPIPAEPSGTDALKLEALSLENEKVRWDLAAAKEHLGRGTTYAGRTFILVATWISVVFLLLILQGFGSLDHFHLSDTVLGLAIGSTTANVIGMLLIVLKGIFPTVKK